MKVIAYDRFRPGVTMETITPLLPEEVANVWRLWKAGIVRENYARADVPGVVIVFEVDGVDEARRYAVVECDRPGPPHCPGPAPDRPYRRRLLGGVQS